MTACIAVNYRLSRHYLVMEIADQTEIELSIAFCLAKGPFKCYVTLEGVGGCMPKRYEALRGGGGGYVSVT